MQSVQLATTWHHLTILTARRTSSTHYSLLFFFFSPPLLLFVMCCQKKFGRAWPRTNIVSTTTYYRTTRLPTPRQISVRTYIRRLCIHIYPFKFFSALQSFCCRLSVVLLSYHSRSTLIQRDRRKKNWSSTDRSSQHHSTDLSCNRK